MRAIQRAKRLLATSAKKARDERQVVRLHRFLPGPAQSRDLRLASDMVPSCCRQWVATGREKVGMRFQPFRRPGAPIGSSRQPETSMRRSTRRGRGKGAVVLLALTIAAFRVEAQYAQAQDLGARYPTMAPIAQYRMD